MGAGIDVIQRNEMAEIERVDERTPHIRHDISGKRSDIGIRRIEALDTRYKSQIA